MKPPVAILAAAIGLGLIPPPPAEAGVIERACLKSDRPSASPKLCRCIQKVANRELSPFERRKVARWFDDPHEAQKVRQSSRPRDKALWKRYRVFGEKARKSCR